MLLTTKLVAPSTDELKKFPKEKSNATSPATSATSVMLPLIEPVYGDKVAADVLPLTTYSVLSSYVPNAAYEAESIDTICSTAAIVLPPMLSTTEPVSIPVSIPTSISFNNCCLTSHYLSHVHVKHK